MDEMERLIEAFEAHAGAPVSAKLDALLELERRSGPRVVPFVLDVLADRREPTPVRIHVLKRLRSGQLMFCYRTAVAEAIVRVLAQRGCPDLRLQAALALTEFFDVDGVLTSLGALALNPDEPIDLRYSAFTAIQRAGPTAECTALLRRLATDELLGRCARGVLSLWRVP
jgi:hypothetical protein